MRTKLWCLLTLTAFLMLDHGSAAQNAGFQLIVHADNPTTELQAAKASKMFLKKIARWDHGEPVMPVDQVEQSEVREAFSEGIHGKSVSAIKSYWQRMIFSGRDVNPPELRTDADVLAYVRSQPGAIGYVASSADLGTGVKTLTVTE